MVDKRIYRSRNDKILGGVCSGIGQYLDIDPVIIRLIALLLLFTCGTGILIYICAWILIPLEPEEEVVTARVIS
ncbi:PspC domain-containing protein [Methanospirillum lacunae]|uniref:PspC domain-containing protein n=1 Tax=Methanospirillum lacunae TaxID=668570 RepID=A0A2V2MT54_9EURY|nr:PspC domain-containing protein [Methanospirillum lacunae]PWR71374.1 PspC domain-containing protein [Methanospirillum lacunae]